MAKMKFLLRDETGKAPDLGGRIEVHADGIYIMIDDDRGAVGSEVAVQLYRGKLDVSVWGDPDSDEPSHVVTLRKAGPKDWRPRR